MKNDDLENLDISFFIIYLCACCDVESLFYRKRDSRITVHRGSKSRVPELYFSFENERTDVRASIVLYTRESARAQREGVKYFFSKATKIH